MLQQHHKPTHQILCILKGLVTLSLFIGSAPAYTGGPNFGPTLDVNARGYTASAVGPRYVLDDSNSGETDWAIQTDEESLDQGFTISHNANFPTLPIFDTHPFRIESGTPTNSLYIDSGGSVGIGTAAPAEALHISSLSPRIRFEDNNSQNWNIEASSSGFSVVNVTNNRPAIFVSIDAMSNALIIDPDGVSINGTIRISSSRSLKQDIRRLNPQEARTAVQHLSPVHFRYKDGDQQQLGFIAEDLPALIATEDRKGLRPMDVVTLLTSVVQQHDEKLEQQDQKFSQQLENQLKQQSEQLKQQKETNETLSESLDQYKETLSQQTAMIAMLMERIERLEAPRETKSENL